ncbi:MAG: hypothetical protein KatS3mg108_0246 [Isosphaeraceae bacterium]|jgi:hypothetical protein|nr:MAG: hypothetical protein KatS3mg108_0246 [Isosphaeraceae bacterium]
MFTPSHPEPHRRPLVRRPQTEPLEPRHLLVSFLTIPGSGSLQYLALADDTSFQILRSGDLHGPIFAGEHSPGDAGLFVRPQRPDGSPGPVVGIDVVGRRALGWRTTAAATTAAPWFPILHRLDPDGLGALLIADNRNDANTDGLVYLLVHHVRYAPGTDAFRVDATLINLADSPLTLDAFAAADLYLDDRNPANDFNPINDDFGFGWHDPTTGAIGGTDFLGTSHFAVAPNPETLVQPTHFQAGHYATIWRTIASGNSLSNSVLTPTLTPPSLDDPNLVNNAAALQWANQTIPPGGSLLLSYSWSFSSPATSPPATPPSLTTFPIQATAGSPLHAPIARIEPSTLPTTPADYLATISWGDGSPPTLASIVPDPNGPGFLVTAPHTYSRPGLFPVTITLIGPEAATSSVRTTATIANPISNPPPPPPTPGSLTISGQLDPNSDLGPSNSDAITSNPSPRFLGHATPNASITLQATHLASSFSASFSTTATADGSWSLQIPSPLPDGPYTIIAKAQLNQLSTQTTLLDPTKPLVIDTQGPRISSLSVNRRTGRLVISFDDPGSTLDTSSLSLPNTFQLSRRIRRIHRPIPLRLAQSSPSRVILATRPFPLGASYTFMILPTIHDLAGNPLDGAFNGRFPSGSGQPGSPFIASLQANRANLLAVRPSSPFQPLRPRRR